MDHGGQSTRASRGLSKKREAQILLPVAVLVLVVLSTFTLFAYKNAVDLALDERREEAERLARWVARDLRTAGVLPRADELGQDLERPRGVALLDESGFPLVTRGELTAPERSDAVSGHAEVRLAGRRLSVRVDLPAVHLRASRRGLAVLVPLVLGVDVAMTLLLILYWRHLWTPIGRLLDQAREAGRLPESTDELSFLLETFEDALEALQAPAATDLDATLHALTQSLESGVLLCDGEGTVLALNKTGAALVDVALPATGRRVGELLAAHGELARALETAIREGHGLGRGEYTLRVGTEERTLGLTLHPLRLEDGTVRGFLTLFIDLTAIRRQAEEQRLAESLAQIGEVAAGVAHEMRNALASLSGYLSLIERRPEAEPLASYLGEMRHEADHLKRVVDDFLTFARPGSARMEEVDLVRLLRRAAADPALGDVAVRFDGAGGEPRLVGDGQLLERAFKNLLGNAAEAERGGRGEAVEVGWRRRGANVEVTIKDRGPGLPEAIRDRLFHPFVSGRADGVGLGLALTHRIVELHRGSVRLADRDGGGAVAVVTLPMTEEGS